MNEWNVCQNFCNETLSKTNFPLGRIKVHLILSYLIRRAATRSRIGTVLMCTQCSLFHLLEGSAYLVKNEVSGEQRYVSATEIRRYLRPETIREGRRPSQVTDTTPQWSSEAGLQDAFRTELVPSEGRPRREVRVPIRYGYNPATFRPRSLFRGRRHSGIMRTLRYTQDQNDLPQTLNFYQFVMESVAVCVQLVNSWMTCSIFWLKI